MQSAKAGWAVEWLPDDQIITVGGWDNNNQPTATVEMLECFWSTEEPANGGWRYVAPMNYARGAHAVAFTGGKIIAAGGKGGKGRCSFTTVQDPPPSRRHPRSGGLFFSSSFYSSLVQRQCPA